MKNLTISIVIPAYNEEKRMGRTLDEYLKFFSLMKKQGKIENFEILVVINNTKDRTEEIIREKQKKFKELKYLNFKQGGKGFAIREGFKDALKRDIDLIGFVDADMATSPEEYFKLAENIKNYDGMIASRWMKNSQSNQSFKRKFLSRGFNIIVRALFLFPYMDTQCGAKVFKRRVIEKVVSELGMTQWAFDINLLYLCRRNRFKIKEYPTIWEDKEGSKIKPSTTIQMFSGIIRLRLIYSPFEKISFPVKFILRIADKMINKRK